MPGTSTAKAEEETSVQDMIVYLMDSCEMIPQEIIEAMDNRVSTRTIYRWAKGESDPQNPTDHAVLKALYRRKKT